MENSSLFKFTGILILALVGYTVYRTEVANREIAELKEQIAVLKGGGAEPQAQAAAKDRPEEKVEGASEGRSILRTLFGSKGNGPSAAKEDRKKKIEVSARLSLDNRYATYKLNLPEYVGEEPGTVVVNITATQVGSVVAASIGPGTTIKDRDVLDQCKEAALKTDISTNWEAPRKQSGTITYTFE